MADFDYQHLVKTLMLGDTQVGKTSLVQRFCENKFEAFKPTTIGIDFKRKDLERNGAKLRLQVWDTAGQERFRTITNSYYRSAGSVIVCFAVDARETFDGVSTWLQQIKEHGDENVKCVLVANKTDLPDRKVSKEEGMALAKAHNLAYFEVSAKSGENVDLPFFEIIDLLTQEDSNSSKNATAKKSGGVRLDDTADAQKKPCAC